MSFRMYCMYCIGLVTPKSSSTHSFCVRNCFFAFIPVLFASVNTTLPANTNTQTNQPTNQPTNQQTNYCIWIYLNFKLQWWYKFEFGFGFGFEFDMWICISNKPMNGTTGDSQPFLAYCNMDNGGQEMLFKIVAHIGGNGPDLWRDTSLAYNSTADLNPYKSANHYVSPRLEDTWDAAGGKFQTAYVLVLPFIHSFIHSFFFHHYCKIHPPSLSSQVDVAHKDDKSNYHKTTTKLPQNYPSTTVLCCARVE